MNRAVLTVRLAVKVVAPISALALLGAASCQPSFDDQALVGTWTTDNGDQLVIKQDLSATIGLSGSPSVMIARARRDPWGGVFIESSSLEGVALIGQSRSAFENRLVCTGCVLDGDLLTCDAAPFPKKSSSDPFLGKLDCRWKRSGSRSALGLGAPCSTSLDCTSRSCTTLGYCGSTCTTDADCSGGAKPMTCSASNCFPVCTSAADCSSYKGPNGGIVACQPIAGGKSVCY